MADTGADDSTSTGKEIARIYPRPCEKVPPRGYRERSRAYIPEAVRKSTAERVQERKPRVYTRDRAEKYRRAGTVKETARIYPRSCGKIPPRGYRERNRAYIPETVRKSTAARVQGKKPRGYTRDRAEKYRRAGTGKETARIYPRLCGKIPPRGYRERNRADIPETGGKIPPHEYRRKISRMKMSFFAIFASMGLILLIVSLILKNKDKKMTGQCTMMTKGWVIKYTLWNNNGVHFPIVEYIVNDTKYNQRLKYGWVVKKSSSFNKIRTEVENDVKDGNLVIKSNAHISTNALKEHFPVGTELDVFYNPQNPGKSYVMRYVKNPAVKVLFIIGLAFVILAFIGLAFLPE